MNRQLRSRSQINPPNHNRHHRTNQSMQKDPVTNMSHIVAYWGDKEDTKLPPINIIVKEDFYEYQPFEIKFKLFQSCFAYNNIVHREFELKYINSPDLMIGSDIHIEYKVYINDCYMNKPSYSKSDHPTMISFYAGTVDNATSCMYQIEYLPEHLLSSSKTIRGIFYHYYLNYKNENLPLVNVYKVPIIFKSKQLMRFKVMAPTISDSVQNGLLSLVYITEKYVPLRNIIQKKLEIGKYSYDEKLYIAVGIMSMVDRLENACIVSLDLNMDNILITEEGHFKISTITLVPFISLSTYKENHSMYDDYERLMKHLTIYRTKSMHPPEIKRKEQIIDYRAVTRYHLGLILLQLYNDIPNMNYYEDARIQQLVYQLQQSHTGHLEQFILQFLSGDPKTRLAIPLNDLIESVYDVSSCSLIQQFDSFFNKPSIAVYTTSSQQSINQVNMQIPSRQSRQSKQILQSNQSQESQQFPNIAVITPSKTKRTRDVVSKIHQGHIRERNLIAEIHFNFYLLHEALDLWQYLLPDLEDAYSTESIEYEYILERIWVLAEYLSEKRVLDQISDKYLKVKKGHVTNHKDHLALGYLLMDQARVKGQLDRNLEAIELYKQANKTIEIVKGKFNNSSGINHSHIGSLYAKELDFNKARTHLEYSVYTFTKMEKSSIVPFLISSSWQLEDQVDTVKEPVDRIKFWLALHNLGRYYYDDGNLQKALGILVAAQDMYMQIKKNQPQYDEFMLHMFTSHIDGLSMLAKCYLDNDETDEAYSLAEMGLNINTESLKTKQLLDIKVQILIKRGKIAEALSTLGLWVRRYQRVNGLTVETAQLLKDVGDLAYQHNDCNVSFSFYSKALSIFKNSKVSGLRQKADNARQVDMIESNMRVVFKKLHT